MASMFKKSDVVRVKTVVPQGPVQKLRMDEETGEVLYLIDWVDQDGRNQSRWFSEAELEVVV